jgi:uncharacterized protein GlcG (DUF336 family)
VAVVDVAGEVIVLRRDDGGLIDLPGGIVDSIQHLYGGDFVPFAGGVLVTGGELILGAAGASGARAVEDEEAVQTAVQRWQENRSVDSQN